MAAVALCCGDVMVAEALVGLDPCDGCVVAVIRKGRGEAADRVSTLPRAMV